jgi:serine/threonine-protein kinase
MQIGEGTRLGGYRVVRKIGEGGMGAVFEAVHERLQKRVAIKTMHEQFARDAGAVARFTREGRAASRIRHAHVVDIADVGMEQGTPYLVMELLEGESLASLIRRHGPLPLDAIADIALPVLDALDAAHQAGIVHRDLKPENIFLTRSRSGSDAHPMVLDFGISCIEDEVRMTKTAHFMGTPHYMSPEQAQSARAVDARSDQFSMGLVLFECVTGRRALSGDSVLEVVHRVSTEGAIRLGVVRPDLPRPFTQIIDTMTERDPTARFRSMRHVGEQIIAFASPRGAALWGQSFAAGRRSLPGSNVPVMPTPSMSSAPSASFSSPGPTPSIPVSVPSSFATRDAPQASFSQPATRSSTGGPGTPHPLLTPSFQPRARTPSMEGAALDSRGRARTPSSVSGSMETEAPIELSRRSRTPSVEGDAVAARRRAPSTDDDEPVEIPGTRRSPVLLAVVAVACVAIAVGVAFVVGTTLAREQQQAHAAPETSVAPPTTVATPPPSTTTAGGTFDVRVRAVPASAEIVLDGVTVGTGTYSAALTRDGIPHLLEVRASGYIPHDIQFLDMAPVAEIQLEAVPSHHHGPIVPQRSQMTANGLVAATAPLVPATSQAAGANGAVPPVTTTPPATDVAPPVEAPTPPPETTTTAPPPPETTVAEPAPPPSAPPPSAAPPPTTRADWATEGGAQSDGLISPY